MAVLLGAGCTGGRSLPEGTPSSYAVYYGDRPLYQRLDQYDWVIVPDTVAPERHSRTRFFAYLSIGEVDQGGKMEKALQKQLGQKGFRKVVLDKNQVWHSWVSDMRNPVYSRLLRERIARDVRSGFGGIFFDTVDSPLEYRRVHPGQSRGLKTALVRFIQTIHRDYPGIKLILNRGFEILPAVAPDLSGVLFEDFCSRYDDQSHRYLRVSEADRESGLAWIRRARRIHPGLVALSLDYGDPKDRPLKEKCRKMAFDAGLIPYFSDRNLYETP